MHGVRRATGTIGDPLIVPIVCALCGLGLLTMASVNDPLRDRLLFEPFAVGVALGCVALTAASQVDFRRLELRPLRLRVPGRRRSRCRCCCSSFGSGPGPSGVKVNLFGVQPVEAIRPLVALFLAGYFARRWELLRELRAIRRAAASRSSDACALPRVADVIPVAVGMALVLLFFFFQRDLGPALVISLHVPRHLQRRARPLGAGGARPG